MTTVSEIMTSNVRTLAPTDTVQQAAQTMEELNVGAIPVCDGQKVLGMVTDRDIVLRCVAKGGDAKTTKLADVMTPGVRCASEGDDIDEVLREMADAQIRRMPVLDGQKRLVGIVSLGDVAVMTGDDDVGATLGEISESAGSDR